MKRQILKSLSTLCVSAMALFATSSLVVSCYDDGALWDAVEDVQGDVDELSKTIAEVQAKLEALTSRVDALYTLKFQVTTENELQYSFDGGTTWVSTGIDLAEECACPEVTLVDNGDTVTISVGEQSFTIEKPEEIVFEIRAGKVYFESEGTQTVVIKTSGIEDITVMSAPKGWYADINSDGMVEIKAPDYESTQSEGYWNDDWTEYIEVPATAAQNGYVKIHACSKDGKCLVGKLSVEVSRTGIDVKAYGGKYYINTANAYTSYYYGVAVKDTYAEEAGALLKALMDNNYQELDSYKYATGAISGDIEEVLKAKLEVGKEYVVYAIQEYAQSYTLDDLVLAYYSPVEVSILEDESKRTAYNVTITVDVLGADSYVAFAMPSQYCETEDDIEYRKEEAIYFLSNGEYYGKHYKESYVGSVLDIAAGTQFSMTGLYQPNSEVHLFVLPLDGRPLDAYTTADVVVKTFKTNPLSSGGAINVSVEQVSSYIGNVWDYDTNEYVEKEIVLDPYTQLGVSVQPDSEGKWSSLFISWMSAEEYALYESDDALLVDAILDGEGFAYIPDDVKKFPVYETLKVDPNTSVYFVSFFVDDAGNYGELAKLPLTSKEMVYSDIVIEDIATNLADDVLKNVQVLELTPDADGAVSAYKYLRREVYYDGYEPFDFETDMELANAIHFDADAIMVNSADLVDGMFKVENHEYGVTYALVVLPYDAEGNPGKKAYRLEYTCSFALDNVITSSYVGEPKITCNWYYYSEEGVDYYKNPYTRYNYDLAYTVEPSVGYPVTVVAVDVESYPRALTATAAEKASQVILGKYGSYYTKTFAETGLVSRSFTHLVEDGMEPKSVLIMAVWSDAEGTYYYKEVDLSADFANMKAELDEGYVPTPAGNQYKFSWDAIATAYEVESVVGLLDFGATLADNFLIAYDPAFMGAPAGTPYQVFGGVYGYKFEAVDATSGKLIVTVQGMGMDAEPQSVEYSYSNLTATSCDFDFGDGVMLQGQSKVSGTAVTVAVDVPM